MFNSGAVLLCRLEGHHGHSHLCVARFANGINGWQVEPQPGPLPEPEQPHEPRGDVEYAVFPCN